MKINFKDFVLKSIDWTPVTPETPLHQIIGNKVWEFTNDLWVKEIAEKIYKGEEVEINSSQVEFIKTTMNDPKSGLMPFFWRELNIYIDAH